MHRGSSTDNLRYIKCLFSKNIMIMNTFLKNVISLMTMCFTRFCSHAYDNVFKSIICNEQTEHAMSNYYFHCPLEHMTFLIVFCIFISCIYLLCPSIIVKSQHRHMCRVITLFWYRREVSKSFI